MVLDYSERRPVNKNRPKKGRGNGLLVLFAIAALGTFFALGFVVGWFAGKGRQNAIMAERPVETPKDAVASRPQPPATGNAGGVEPPLTFYNTLPKGSRAVIGSGLNPPKAQEKHPPATAAPAASPTTTGAAVPEGKPVSQPPKAPEHPAAEKEKKPAEAVRYTVQLASYRERREAEAVRDKLVAKGVAAFLLESRLADKGVWYRLRVGKGLTQQQAGEVAAKLGREALVVPE